jgi:hypothetical protein
MIGPRAPEETKYPGYAALFAGRVNAPARADRGRLVDLHPLLARAVIRNILTVNGDLVRFSLAYALAWEIASLADVLKDFPEIPAVVLFREISELNYLR